MQQQQIGKIADEDVKEQMRVGQTVTKINTLMDVLEGVNSDNYDGIQRLNIVIKIENKILDLIDQL